jgi:Kef-type K+ transport system membrane component KefB
LRSSAHANQEIRVTGTIGLLFALLVLSYVGSAFSGPRVQRLFGLPSGAEYLVLGFVLGPVMLAVIRLSWVETFEPMTTMGSAWLALLAGLDCGRASRSEVRLRVALGIALTALVAFGVALAVWLSLGFWGSMTGKSRLTLALGVGILSCATTQHALRWTIAGYRSGLLSAALLDLSRASPVVPVLMLAALHSAEANPASLGIPVRIGIDLGVGVVLGGLASLLLSREFRRDESWGLVLGVGLFATGTCAGLGLSAVAAMFALGLTLALSSKHRDEIRSMLLPTERSVVLPVALLAGASVNPLAYPVAGVLALVTVSARTVMELLRGLLICTGVRAARPAGPLVGLSLTSAGSFTLAASVEMALHYKGALGTTLMTVGSIVLLWGEALGPMMLRRALERSGDIADVGPPSDALLAAPEATKGDA